MRYAPFAIAALLVFGAACSNDERETSLVPEAQAAAAQPQKDYGWRTSPSYPVREERPTYEYQ